MLMLFWATCAQSPKQGLPPAHAIQEHLCPAALWALSNLDNLGLSPKPCCILATDALVLLTLLCTCVASLVCMHVNLLMLPPWPLHSLTSMRACRALQNAPP